MSLKKILIVDDEKKIIEVVKAYLEKEGFKILTANDGRNGLDLAKKESPDLLILDLMLPDMSGEEVCSEIRKESSLPILMLTAKSSEEHRVEGFALGADDYLVKPFSPKELVARVKAIIRRTYGKDKEALEIMKFNNGKLIIEFNRHRVIKNGVEISLTPNEFKLLVVLAREQGRVFSRLQLIDKVQGYDFEGYERTIDAHIKNLRHKIENNPDKPVLIKTVYGVGYRFEGIN
ncbi:MAG: response regulator transcription factor [Firmicutes bacterium]|nr:response regulator transcription factor [Bacillota bacterium]